MRFSIAYFVITVMFVLSYSTYSIIGVLPYIITTMLFISLIVMNFNYLSDLGNKNE